MYKRRRYDDDWYAAIEALERQYKAGHITISESIKQLRILQENRPQRKWWQRG